MWDATGLFQLDAEIAHSYGSAYSLAVTKKYVIVGEDRPVYTMTPLGTMEFFFTLFFYCIVTGTYNRNTHIFEIPSYQHIKALTGHIGAVTVVTASPAGRYLFTASSDSTAMVWTHNNESFLAQMDGRTDLYSLILCYSS